MADENQISSLMLYRTPRVGPMTYRELLRVFSTPEMALENLPALMERAGRKPLQLYPRSRAEEELNTLASLGGRLMIEGDSDWPDLLSFDAAPPMLMVRGLPHLLERRAVAIVGARDATTNGCRLAEQIGADMAAAGWLVVSGMARGIDTAAHVGALLEGTAAILAGGVDVPYPAENEGLYEKIILSGLVASEAPMGAAPAARHFPRRNRIVSGLAHGTLVIEAAKGSGSLITAGYASEQGRVVMAVPGSPLDERSQGCNSLIREGAFLVENADDVIEILAREAGVKSAERLGQPEMPLLESVDEVKLPTSAEHSRIRERVLSLMGASATEVSALVHQSEEFPRLVHLVLLELELSGEIERLAGDKVIRIMLPPRKRREQ
ncbi:MAG: DNA-processing protein DprA [Alphaproteobacteria bacterium]|nr:DNA-processing protein DprA [Alphaproteobacteria bacterium]MDA7982807.1 DNA-processing protein DprA [Alphaproteobacteria bacterium]MDA8010314.1 DNA-processing protein DprA [Alphaproteobacteria bacterium]